MTNPYGRKEGEPIHKAINRRYSAEKERWTTPCGTKISQKKPYSQSSYFWRFVTCEKCLERKGK